MHTRRGLGDSSLASSSTPGAGSIEVWRDAGRRRRRFLAGGSSGRTDGSSAIEFGTQTGREVTEELAAKSELPPY